MCVMCVYCERLSDYVCVQRRNIVCHDPSRQSPHKAFTVRAHQLPDAVWSISGFSHIHGHTLKNGEFVLEKQSGNRLEDRGKE